MASCSSGRFSRVMAVRWGGMPTLHTPFTLAGEMLVAHCRDDQPRSRCVLDPQGARLLVWRPHRAARFCGEVTSIGCAHSYAADPFCSTLYSECQMDMCELRPIGVLGHSAGIASICVVGRSLAVARCASARSVSKVFLVLLFLGSLALGDLLGAQVASRSVVVCRGKRSAY